MKTTLILFAKKVLGTLLEPTPDNFKRVRNTAIKIIAVAGATLLLPVTLPTLGISLTIPTIVLTAAKSIVAAGTVLGITAQATTTNDLNIAK